MVLPQVQIRSALVSDGDVLAELSSVVQALHADARSDVFKPVDYGRLRAWFVDAVTRGAARVFIAEVEGRPAGYSVLVEGSRSENAFAYERRWLEVEQLGVREEHRRHGVARALVEHAAGVARSIGASSLELSVWSFNQDAQAAFRRLGFVPRVGRYERPLLGL